ncbi:S-layer homology domain-containing protein [Sporosarcina sp. PTS2304]|uniref:S-layer homology domain-containing protein n=1 Tax=Sporosarcina sp. PTS2304 TaxID=2283194 RepID=UPI000E0D7AD5|nr:S-layer homology domain-containing protein [Sporosarcina sp. PTS2304]AXI00528.1 S-layer homology domain-containing protein [Sporosarcina sp. PTS2304]
MKKILIGALTALFIFAAIPFQTQAATSFSDVEKHWAKKEIMYLSERNIIGGYPDGTFKPNEAITRAQAASMLVKALKIPLVKNPTITFKDVSKNSPYYQILATVNEKGILRGDNGLMRPGEETSRVQMAAILRRSFKLPLDKQATFVDVSESHWAFEDVNGIAKKGITGGSNGKFMPGDSVTRAQFSAFLVRALDDSMKLSEYHSYVAKKGTTVEQNGFSYTIAKDKTSTKLFKKNLKAGTQVAILDKATMPDNGTNRELLMPGYQLIMYNDDLYIPFWNLINDKTNMPSGYNLTKINANTWSYTIGTIPIEQKFRNMFIWNDRIFYTIEKNKERVFDSKFNPENPIDDPLILYSTTLDGKNKKQELVFDARVIFHEVERTSKDVQVSHNNKSVLFDHSAMYYFNKTGVYKYNLLDKKTTKLASVVAKDMQVETKQLVVTDQQGKKHSLKK